jgi:serine/threonine-protein kinase
LDAAADSTPTLPSPGEIIGGKYEVLRCIGEGGMGVVFEAMHLTMRQRVAVKVLRPSVLSNPEVILRFEREGRAAGQLRGRHVARVLDVDSRDERLPYMVMELLEGHDLATELEERGPLPVAEAVSWLIQACAGIAEAHAAGIVHRDLKPSNLFLAKDGAQSVLKLLDFGISKIFGEASRLTSTELTMGTPLYMSPEQVRSAKNVDARTDIWALGVILYELLSGAPPFLGSAPSVAVAIVNDAPPPIPGRTDVPAALAAVVHKAMAKNRAERFADARALAAALAPFAVPRASPSSSSSAHTAPARAPGLGYAETVLGLQPAAPARTGSETVVGAGRASGRSVRARALRTGGLVAALGVVALAGAAMIVSARRSGGPPRAAVAEAPTPPSAAVTEAPAPPSAAVTAAPAPPSAAVVQAAMTALAVPPASVAPAAAGASASAPLRARPSKPVAARPAVPPEVAGQTPPKKPPTLFLE